jgi:hypothetical protein
VDNQTQIARYFMPGGGSYSLSFMDTAGGQTIIIPDSRSLSDSMTLSSNANSFIGSNSFLQTLNLYDSSRTMTGNMMVWKVGGLSFLTHKKNTIKCDIPAVDRVLSVVDPEQIQSLYLTDMPTYLLGRIHSLQISE